MLVKKSSKEERTSSSGRVREWSFCSAYVLIFGFCAGRGMGGNGTVDGKGALVRDERKWVNGRGRGQREGSGEGFLDGHSMSEYDTIKEAIASAYKKMRPSH